MPATRFAASSTFLPFAGPMPVSTTSTASSPRMIPIFGTSGTRRSGMTKTPLAISLMPSGVDIRRRRAGARRCIAHGGRPPLGSTAPASSAGIGHFKLKASRSARTETAMADALIALHFQNDICHPDGRIPFSLNREARRGRGIPRREPRGARARARRTAGRSSMSTSPSPRTIPTCRATAACSRRWRSSAR